MEPIQSPRDVQAVIESLVALTAQRDQHSLEDSLIATLETLLDARCEIFQVPDNYAPEIAHRRSLPEDDTRLPDPIRHALARIIREDAPLSLAEADGTRHLIKLRGTPQEGHRILSALARENSGESRRLILGLAMVYRNFVDLLSDNEHDTLTGLYNRKKLEASLATFCAPPADDTTAEGSLGSYLAILDLDHFKRINDTHGHLIGDEVLLIFAEILRRTLRGGDLIFRYGGEEFMILLKDITEASARAILERVRENVAHHDFPQVGRVTVSIGYSRIVPPQLPTQIIEEADRALYYAKENGRDRVCHFQDLIARQLIEDAHASGSIELF